MSDLEGKVALVTGGNRGIGRGCVVELARRGAAVAINYRQHREEAEEVAAEVKALGRTALILQADVADRAQDEQMVRRTVEELGRLDILVSNAAYSVRKPFLEMEEPDMAVTLGVTLWGPFHVSQFAARQMVRQEQGGSIVFVSSVHAVLAMLNSLAYNTAKAGLNHMARSMAAELAAHKIRVNVVEPGWTDTPGERAFATEEQLREGGKRLPLGRLATMEEVAKGVVFLASEDASYVTGATLRIDGGYVLPRAK